MITYEEALEIAKVYTIEKIFKKVLTSALRFSNILHERSACLSVCYV